MTSKLINLLALSSLAILACSFGPVSVNALSVDPHVPRHLARGHNEHFARKKKRDTTRCKARQPDQSPAAQLANPPASADPTNGQPAPATDNSPAATPSPAPAPSPAPQNNNNNSGSKLGLAWANGLTGDAVNDLNHFNRGKNNKLYTWSPDHTAVNGFDPVPMLWGPNQVSQFQQQVNAGNAGGHVMGFNEPNQSGQSDITPEYGCQLWKDNIVPLKNQGVRTVSPAPTSNPQTSMSWLKTFFDQGCDVDVIALHWYDIDVNNFIGFVTNMHNTFNKPIWVTEYACQNFNDYSQQCSTSQVWNLHQSVKAWMDSQDWIECYFPFGLLRDMQGVNVDNQLMNQDGTPTALGAWYLDNQ